MLTVRAVIVEDEALGRRAIRDLASEAGWLAIVGEAGDGATAIDLIDALDPDLVFLDVELPECSGLRVIERSTRKPALVFVTAYDRYAISAFDLEAIDYLVKPFGRARFAQTLRRIEAHFRQRPPASGEPLDTSQLTRLFLPKRQEILRVDVQVVTRLVAERDYTRVFAGREQYLSQMSLGEFARRLDPRRFVRVHRSMIVNLDQVRSIRRLDHRRFIIRMSDRFEAIASRSGSERLRQAVREHGGVPAIGARPGVPDEAQT